MSKITDMFNHILGLDPNKDYDFKVEEHVQEQNKPPEQDTNELLTKLLSQLQANQQSQQNNQNQQNVQLPQNQQFDQSNKIDALEKELANVKAMNLALLTRTAVPDADVPIEKTILDVVQGINTGRKEDSNVGNNGINW